MNTILPLSRLLAAESVLLVELEVEHTHNCSEARDGRRRGDFSPGRKVFPRITRGAFFPRTGKVSVTTKTQQLECSVPE